MSIALVVSWVRISTRSEERRPQLEDGALYLWSRNACYWIVTDRDETVFPAGLYVKPDFVTEVTLIV